MMKRLLPRIPAAFVVALASVTTAQVPNTLQHYLPAPPAGAQTDLQLGKSVAVDEGSGLTVVGIPHDDYGQYDSGIAKVFNTATGALLHVLVNPSPASNDQFGARVAVSGTLLVVSAPQHDAGFIDTGIVYVYDLAGATPATPVATLENPGPGTSDYFGMAVAVSGTRVVVGAFQDDTAASDSGSAYVFDLGSATPAVSVVTLNNPGPAAFDNFGSTVAVSGTRVVIGAPGDDTGASAAGIAYVYDVAGATPAVPVATLNNPTPVASDAFGTSVAVSGTRVVVGAHQDDTGASNAGSAYVYDLAGATPATPVATLNNPAPGSSDLFGWSVAVSGPRVVVGAYQDDTGASNAGSAYVYDLTGGTPTVPVLTLNKPGPAANDNFGWTVAVSGMQIVIGAPQDDTGASNAGSAYIYNAGIAAPTVPVLKLNQTSPASGDFFGTTVTVSGLRIVVGVPFDDTAAANAGVAYVYDAGSATPAVPVVTLPNPGPAPGDQFGISVAVSGTRVVVGAPMDDTGASNAGSVYVYDLSSATPAVPVETLNNPGPAAGDQFGTSVAVSGTRVIVGAPLDATGAAGAGSVYVYDLSSATPTVPVETLNNPAPAAADQFGNSVAVSGTRVVVGSLLDDTGAVDSGSAYVYDLTSATPTVPAATLHNPGPAVDDRFGASVAISGTRVVVGAFFDDTGAADSGSAYVYDLSSGTPTVPVETLNNPGPAVDDRFGSSVAISGTRVLVGAFYDDTGATDSGSAYVYDLSSASPAVPAATLTNPSPATGEAFGRSVALDGTLAAIGIPGDDSPQWDKGSVGIYAPGPAGPPNYDEWSALWFGAPGIPPAHPAADPDGDGVQNLVEFAVNTSPVAASIVPITHSTRTPGGLLQLAITVRNNDPVLAALSGRGEGSATLSSFTGSFPPAVTDPVPGDGYALWTFTDQPPAGTHPRRFLRVVFQVE